MYKQMVQRMQMEKQDNQTSIQSLRQELQVLAGGTIVFWANAEYHITECVDPIVQIVGIAQLNTKTLNMSRAGPFIPSVNLLLNQPRPPLTHQTVPQRPSDFQNTTT